MTIAILSPLTRLGHEYQPGEQHLIRGPARLRTIEMPLSISIRRGSRQCRSDRARRPETELIGSWRGLELRNAPIRDRRSAIIARPMSGAGRAEYLSRDRTQGGTRAGSLLCGSEPIMRFLRSLLARPMLSEAGRPASERKLWSEWQDLNLRPPRPERVSMHSRHLLP